MSAAQPSPGARRGRPGPAGTVFGRLRRAAINPGRGVGVSAERFWLTLLVLGLCQVADLLTFNMAVVAFGPARELGPLGMVYQAGGIAAVAFVKLGLVFIIMTALRWYPWRQFATRRRMALLMAVIGVFGALTNLLAWI
jgi:hypothetical protein